MIVKINTAPTSEPVTLAELKTHLRLNSEAIEDNISSEQTISPGDHVVAASYSLTGTGIDVLGYDALVQLVCGTNGTSGTVDVKIQESDDNSDWSDWTTGAFTQVTTANDNATFEKRYTGTKQYIRAVCTVGTATCDFGVDVLKIKNVQAEDDYLTVLLEAVREDREEVLNRAFISQKLDVYLDEFPSEKNYIKLPRAPLISVESVKYTNSAGTEYTMSTDDYDVDTNAEPGRVVLCYGKSWPSVTLNPLNPIHISCTAGYGTTAASVPNMIKQNIMIHVADMYENRESMTERGLKSLGFVDDAMNRYRIWDEM